MNWGYSKYKGMCFDRSKMRSVLFFHKAEQIYLKAIKKHAPYIEATGTILALVVQNKFTLK